MTTNAHHCVLTNVPKLSFGPQSDTFCAALHIALQYMGEPESTYDRLIGWSGRGFRICWSDRLFFWDQHLGKADADPEQYLRTDCDTAVVAVSAAGYEAQMLTVTDERPDVAAMRALVRDSIYAGRPVLAALSLSRQHWAPEWSLITGYDADGATVTGWSCFQDEEPWKEEVDLEPDGTFRLSDWETRTVTAVRLSGVHRRQDEDALGKQALELGVSYARGRQDGLDAWGVTSYAAWAQAVEAADLTDLDAHLLKGRMQYHIRYIGHLAAQRWFTSAFLKQLHAPVFCVSDVLHAAGWYARIHELMWDCWQVAGGYWRDEDGELPKFRDPATRSQIAAIIREAGELDARALQHLETALSAWDKNHGYYMAS